MLFFIALIIAAFFATNYVFGLLACKLVGHKDGGFLKYFGVGFVGSILGGSVLGVFDMDFHASSMPVAFILYVVSLLGVAYVLLPKDTPDDGDDVSTRHIENSPQYVKQEKELKLSSIDYKNLIRVPVWALYSLIVATVIISLVIVANIWVPDAIDEEIIWKIVLTYAVFLVGALVIFNITDKIKEMNKFEERK